MLHAAGLASRFLLAVGGAATVALTAFPRPEVGGSPAHGVVATVAVLALSLWPAGSALRLPRAVRREAAAAPGGTPPLAAGRDPVGPPGPPAPGGHDVRPGGGRRASAGRGWLTRASDPVGYAGRAAGRPAARPWGLDQKTLTP
ncbi:hypothetical protein ACIBP4_05090 [Micromonospora maritima]|uniref:DUF998 domain-containing protein n=1 Tax=Micromonospora maritima TaxID=986711 RepID=A0ABW7ZFP4_9ACTN